MQIIDAQVHTYERNSPARPWKGRLAGPNEVTGEQMISAMDNAGVGAAVATSPSFLYGNDPSYALEVTARWPDRFAVVAPVDVERPDIEDFVAQWAAHPHTIGLRIMPFVDSEIEKLVTGRADRFLHAVARHRQPLCMGCWGQLNKIGAVVRRHPDVQFVIDHLGLQPSLAPPAPPEPFAELPALLALAKFPNVAVKVTGIATLSHREFPYDDIWSPLMRVFHSYGISRCMWGTDWTRAVAFLSFDQAVKSMLVMPGITASERELLMGGNLRKIFRWDPPRENQDSVPALASCRDISHTLQLDTDRIKRSNFSISKISDRYDDLLKTDRRIYRAPGCVLAVCGSREASGHSVRGPSLFC